MILLFPTLTNPYVPERVSLGVTTALVLLEGKKTFAVGPEIVKHGYNIQYAVGASVIEPSLFADDSIDAP